MVLLLFAAKLSVWAVPEEEEEEVEQEEGRVGRWNCILICARVYVCVCVLCVCCVRVCCVLCGEFLSRSLRYCQMCSGKKVAREEGEKNALL